MAIIIRMSWPQVLCAAGVGVRRNIAALEKNRPNRYSADIYQRWSVNIEGAGGELIVSEYYGLPWVAFLEVLRDASGLKPADVGRFIDVRTAPRDTDQLIVHGPEDPAKRIYVSVTGLMPRLTMRGWLWGYEAKQRDWWKDPTGKNRHAYFVPQERLRPIESLRAELVRLGELKE